ncbi:unnamed protein product [Nesidiocoris tenuis]|uniref:Uncharacterized protein n=1 Tax=Nesidiocoris tenuis TaxID=355587 RepID=A0A6H5G9T5_9HEMI|nr:unnamed protein product [Nesidiocoris tenuis]
MITRICSGSDSELKCISSSFPEVPSLGWPSYDATEDLIPNNAGRASSRVQSHIVHPYARVVSCDARGGSFTSRGRRHSDSGRSQVRGPGLPRFQAQGVWFRWATKLRFAVPTYHKSLIHPQREDYLMSNSWDRPVEPGLRGVYRLSAQSDCYIINIESNDSIAGNSSEGVCLHCDGEIQLIALYSICKQPNERGGRQGTPGTTSVNGRKANAWNGGLLYFSYYHDTAQNHRFVHASPRNYPF